MPFNKPEIFVSYIERSGQRVEVRAETLEYSFARLLAAERLVVNGLNVTALSPRIRYEDERRPGEFITLDVAFHNQGWYNSFTAHFLNGLINERFNKPI